MEGRTSRSLSGLEEAGAGEEKSLLGNKEGEKLTGVTSLDTLVPEEEVEAPSSVNQVWMACCEYSLPLNPLGELQGWSGEEKKPAQSSDKTKHVQRWGLDRFLLIAFLSTFLFGSSIPFLLFSSGLRHSLPIRWWFFLYPCWNDSDYFLRV